MVFLLVLVLVSIRGIGEAGKATDSGGKDSGYGQARVSGSGLGV